MLHVFSTNKVKLMAQKQKMTDNLEQREYYTTPMQTLHHCFELLIFSLQQQHRSTAPCSPQVATHKQQ